MSGGLLDCFQVSCQFAHSYLQPAISVAGKFDKISKSRQLKMVISCLRCGNMILNIVEGGRGGPEALIRKFNPM